MDLQPGDKRLKLLPYSRRSNAFRVQWEGNRCGTVVCHGGWWRPTWDTRLSRGYYLQPRYSYEPRRAALILVKQHIESTQRLRRLVVEAALNKERAA